MYLPVAIVVMTKFATGMNFFPTTRQEITLCLPAAAGIPRRLWLPVTSH